MKKLIRKIVPESFIQEAARRGYLKLHGESSLARPRRLKEGFFDLFCGGQGLDIGAGGDAIMPDCDVFELQNGDAMFIDLYVKKQYDFVYASHVLEHMANPGVALRNWWKLVKTNGYLILYVPDRDLFEGKKNLPSNKSIVGEKKNYNNNKRLNPGQHKYFFNLNDDDFPDTIGLLPLVERSLAGCEIVKSKICDGAEHSIEIVCKKL